MGFLLCYAAALLLSIPLAPEYALSAVRRIINDFTIIPGYCYTLLVLWIICLAASTVALIAELFKTELERRLDISMLSTETELAINSYKSLKQQYQEIHALHHDTAKHYYTLRAMLDHTPKRIRDYLDQFVSQNQKIRPIVQSGNEILDILLNGKLSTINNTGIRLDILHSHAPEKLSISDAELCSLMINILDNAINAASAPGSTEPYIRLDLMCKNKYFFFSCENSIANGSAEPEKPPAPEHGHGLKIIKQIVKKHSDIMSIEQSENAFKISIALPI